MLFAESAHLLGRLIKACPRLVLPYVSPILKALVAKLRISPQLQITVATATAPNKAVLVQGEEHIGALLSNKAHCDHMRLLDVWPMQKFQLFMVGDLT